ncbi:MAG TPA: hypothetical protein VEY51_16520 [Chondromyces sp.]|nr:hypothetical protein [Chondromyces sp.]
MVTFGQAAFNLPYISYLTVIDPVMKEKLKRTANGKHKLSTSPAVILVLSDREAFHQASEIYRGLQLLEIINKQGPSRLREPVSEFVQYI